MKKPLFNASVRIAITAVLMVITQLQVDTMGFAQTVTQNLTPVCGSPTAFTDPGGAGNYGPNLHYVYKICPSAPNTYASVTFAPLALGTNDNIVIINGDSSQDPYIATLTGNQANITYTSSSPGGCLTVVFSSDGSNHGAGWTGSYSCTNTAGTNTNVCQETDCIGGCARTVCGSGVYTWQNAGQNMSDLNNINAGCLTAHAPYLERNHVWYYINPQAPGVLEVLIESGAGGQIYDFALWTSTGETITCPILSGDDPILCEAENNGNNNTTPQGSGFSDDVWVDPDNPTNQPYYAYPGYEPPIVVTQADIDAGRVYMLLINVRSNGSPQPVVNIGMDGELDCTPLAVRLVNFYGVADTDMNRLYWETQQEVNNSHFLLERSMNGLDWELLSLVNGAMNSTESINYAQEDRDPFLPVTYYRLKQVDLDGEVTLYRTISLVRELESDQWITVFPNPAESWINVVHTTPNSEETLELQLVDASGRLLYSATSIPAETGSSMALDLSSYASGSYILHCRQGDRFQAEKIVIR